MLQKLYNFLIRNQIVLGIFIIAFGWLLLQIREILTAIFISYIIMAALLPASNYLRSKRFPNILAVMIPYTLVLIFIAIIIFPIVPFFASQIKQLFIGLPGYIDQSAGVLGFSVDKKQIEQFVSGELDSIGKNAFSFTRQLFGGFFSTLTVFVISFYLLLYQERFQDSIARLFNEEEKRRVTHALNQVNDKLGAWLRGQMLLSFSIGIMSWVALTLLNVPYALPLALIAGILEVVPTLGPIIAAVPAVIVAFTISPAHGLIVVLVYVFIQLLENNLLVPKIMQRAVGLNPIIIILAVMIGGNLMGVIGALLSIPFVSFVVVLFHSIKSSKI